MNQAINRQGRKQGIPEIMEQMADLASYVGCLIRLAYVSYGTPHEMLTTLMGVEPFMLIKHTEGTMPFISFGVAIRRIELANTERAEAIYHNPEISKYYDVRDTAEMYRLKTKCFGKETKTKTDETNDMDWRVRRAQFLEGLDLLCRVFDVTMEVNNLQRYLPEYDDGKPRVRSETAFSWAPLREDQFKRAFQPRSVRRRGVGDPRYVGRDD